MLRPLWISVGLLLAGSAVATETVIDSNSPYWEVGSRDPNLSQACSVGRFNQVQISRYIVRLHAKKDDGAAVLGIAKGSGLNLRDPDHRALGSEDYYFRDDGTSNCEVFVGGRKANIGGAAP